MIRRLPLWAKISIGFGLLVLALAAAAMLALRQLAGGDGDLLGTTLNDELTPDKVALAVGMKALPPSARELHSQYAAFQDYIIYTRFAIDAADLPQLETDLALKTPPAPGNAVFCQQSQDLPAWWQPATAATLLVAEGGANATGKSYPDYRCVMIDVTDAAQPVVYITAYDT